jgi:uncharacterized protein DUF11
VTFTTTVTNTSTTTASTGDSATVAAPSGLLSPAVTAGTGSYSNGTWTIGSLAPGASATLTITGYAGDVSAGTQTVTATVIAATPDPNPANNTAAAPEASRPAPFVAVITPGPANQGPPINVCAPPVIETRYASAVNELNPAAPSPTPGSLSFFWHGHSLPDFPFPPPVSGGGGTPFAGGARRTSRSIAASSCSASTTSFMWQFQPGRPQLPRKPRLHGVQRSEAHRNLHRVAAGGTCSSAFVTTERRRVVYAATTSAESCSFEEAIAVALM